MTPALQYDPVANLRQYPVSLARFGQNGYSGNLYRIVFGPSRRHLVCGVWPDGSNCAKWIRTYPNHGDVWVMERWRSAEEFAGPRVNWDLALGPYPERGEYQECFVFDVFSIDDAGLDKIVSWVETDLRRRFSERREWHRADSDKELKDIDSTQEAMIRNKLPAFGVAPMTGFGGGRGTKTAPIVRTAEELGLPTAGGKARTRHPLGPLGGQAQQQFQVPLKA